MRPGQSFESSDVADHYRYRPTYPPELFAQLLELSPGRKRALDLGCGTGKIALGIGAGFESITAVDASAAMLGVGQSHADPATTHIEWRCGMAEETSFGTHRFDLIVAAASIHWMDHAVLFPHLRNHVGSEHVFAVVEGDEAHQPPWQAGWDDFLRDWIWRLTGERYAPASDPKNDDSAFVQRMQRHRQWLDPAGAVAFEHTVSQSIEDFVLCQYSRDTFARSKLGAQCERFAREARGVVAPFADRAGVLQFRVRTQLEWGTIR